MDMFAELEAAIARLPTRAFFRPPASPDDITSLELSLGVRLPRDHARFLRQHDGGFISLDMESTDADWALGAAAWNSNTFLSCSEIREQHNLFKADPQLRRYVPFLRTKDQEQLVFGPPRLFGQQPVLDAFHETGPDAWQPAFDSFRSLLLAYVQGSGAIQAVVSG